MNDAEPAESPFITIWEAPRATIRRIVDADPRRLVPFLFFAGGVRSGMTVSIPPTVSDDMLPLVLALVCIVAGVLAIPTSYLSARYLRWIGSWFGGIASRAEVAASIAWAAVPSIVGTALLLAVRVSLYGAEIFRDEQPTVEAGSTLLTTSLRLAPLIFALWSGVASIVCFAEVNRFSTTRAVFAHLTAAVIALVVVALPFVAYLFLFV